MQFIRYIFFIITLLNVLQAQDTIEVEFIGDNSEDYREVFITDKITESISLYADSIRQAGYWTYSIDTFELETNKVRYFKGEKYDRFKLKPGALSLELFRDLKLDKVTSVNQWGIAGRRISDHFGKIGYPFAKVYLDSLDIQGEEIKASINVDEGLKIKFDSIYVDGDVNLSDQFLMHYLGFHGSDHYEHGSFLDVERKLKALPFLEIASPAQLKFLGDYSSLHLDLKKKNASRFDFLIGINPLQEMGERRVFLTLDLSAELMNQLGQGEQMSFRFARLRPDNQELELKLRYPYPFNLPIALNGSFGLFRNALNFQDVVAEAGVLYLFNNQDYIGVSWDYKSSRVIDIDTIAILNSGELPDVLDVVKNGISIQALKRNVDNIWNPSKGWGISAKLNFSTRTILENNSITELESDVYDFTTLYDEIDKSAIQVSAELRLNQYFRIGQNFSLHLSGRSFWTFSDQEIYDNELRRLGGNKLLRGFDEESFFAESYIIPGLAFNLILDERSFLSIPFVEYGFFLDQEQQWQKALGIGAGITFQTKVGLLNFSLASGKFNEQSFDLARPKVHLGFVSLF